MSQRKAVLHLIITARLTKPPIYKNARYAASDYTVLHMYDCPVDKLDDKL